MDKIYALVLFVSVWGAPYGQVQHVGWISVYRTSIWGDRRASRHYGRTPTAQRRRTAGSTGSVCCGRSGKTGKTQKSIVSPS